MAGWTGLEPVQGSHANYAPVRVFPRVGLKSITTGKAGGLYNVNRPRRFGLLAAHERLDLESRLRAAQERELPSGSSFFHRFNWSSRLSSSSCRRI